MSNYSNNFFGLDIGTTGIRLTQLFRRRDDYELLAAGSLPNTIDINTCEDKKKLDLLSQTIDQLRKECGVTTKNVALALPEAHVFTQLTTMAKLPDEKMDEAIEWEAENFIPIAREEVELDRTFIPIAGEKDKHLVLMLAAPLVKLQNLVRVVEKADLKVIGIESSLLSAGRSLVTKDYDTKTVAILNVGYDNTELAIFKQGLLLATRNITIGGNTVNKNLNSHLSLDWALAEKTKISLANLTGEVATKIQQQVDDVITSLAKEIDRSILYFKERFDELVVTDMLVVGRPLMMNNFLPLLKQKLADVAAERKESSIAFIEEGNPWKEIAHSNSIIEKSPETKLSFASSVGLALQKL